MQGSTNPGAPRTFSYGPSEYQVGDLYLPSDDLGPQWSVCCTAAFGGLSMAAIYRPGCPGLGQTWLCGLESRKYRRLGAAGGGCQAPCKTGQRIDYLATLAADGIAIDLDRVTVIGHSAGGHLALWSAQRDEKAQQRLRPEAG